MFKIQQCDSASAITLPLPAEPTSGDHVISDVVFVINLAVNFARRLSSSLLTLSLQSEDRLMIIVKRQELVKGIQGMTIYPQH